MEDKQFKPYGKVYSGGREYQLLNPQPVPRDSWVNDGAYTFYVAGKDDFGHLKRMHIVVSQFVMELIPDMPSITLQTEPAKQLKVEDILNVHWDAEPMDWEVITPDEIEEEGLNDPVMDDEVFFTDDMNLEE